MCLLPRNTCRKIIHDIGDGVLVEFYCDLCYQKHKSELDDYCKIKISVGSRKQKFISVGKDISSEVHKNVFAHGPLR